MAGWAAVETAAAGAETAAAAGWAAAETTVAASVAAARAVVVAAAARAAAVALASRKCPQPNSKHIHLERKQKQNCPPKRNG